MIGLQTTLSLECSWCKCDMGTKDGKGISGVSHSICPSCTKKHYPETDKEIAAKTRSYWVESQSGAEPFGGQHND